MALPRCAAFLAVSLDGFIARPDAELTPPGWRHSTVTHLAQGA
jgi:hypothetical protein